MRNVKTAISVPADLFAQVERFCKKKKLSRSRLFAEGAKTLLRRYTDREITERLNKVYADKKLSREEAAWARMASAQAAKQLKDDEW